MTSLDLRVGALSLRGNPGTSRTLRLVFTADGDPVTPGPVSVWLGGDERHPTDFTDATELPAVVDGNEATVTVPMPDSRELLRLTIDGALATMGHVAPSLRGTDDQDQTVQLHLGAVEVHLDLAAVPVDPVAVVTDPAAQAALSATFAPVGLQREPYTVPLATSHERSDLTEFIISGKDEETGKLYGQRLSNGNFCTSTDGATFTDEGQNPYVQIGAAPQHMQFTESFMYVTTVTGKIWRAPKDSFDAWTDISVPDLPAATTGRVSVLAIHGDGDVLLYCNYNNSPSPDEGAFVWRSTDNGANWVEVYNLAHPAAKHSHSIKFDPWHEGHVYFSVGDHPWPLAGLHRSVDYGESWEPCAITPRAVGIDMVFPKPIPGVPEMIVLEGDVTDGAHLYVHYKGTDELLPLVWYTGALDDPFCTVASSRGITLTPNGDIIYFTTTENGAFGPRAGIYVARGPWFKESILLEDITGAEPPGYVQSVLTDTHVIQRAVKFNIPEFAR